jgi:hypothetical protein
VQFPCWPVAAWLLSYHVSKQVAYVAVPAAGIRTRGSTVTQYACLPPPPPPPLPEQQGAKSGKRFEIKKWNAMAMLLCICAFVHLCICAFVHLCSSTVVLPSVLICLCTPPSRRPHPPHPRKNRAPRAGSALRSRSGTRWPCGPGPSAQTPAPSAATTCMSQA